jgi:hypothetical protein
LGDANLLPLIDTLRINKTLNALVLDGAGLTQVFFEALGNALNANPDSALNYIGNSLTVTPIHNQIFPITILEQLDQH